LSGTGLRTAQLAGIRAEDGCRDDFLIACKFGAADA
jgi:hypothetical protein